MRYLLWAIGTAVSLFTVGAWIAGLWLEDGRWGVTGIITFFVAFIVFGVSSFTPKPVPHAAKCGGC